MQYLIVSIKCLAVRYALYLACCPPGRCVPRQCRQQAVGQQQGSCRPRRAGVRPLSLRGALTQPRAAVPPRCPSDTMPFLRPDTMHSSIEKSERKHYAQSRPRRSIGIKSSRGGCGDVPSAPSVQSPDITPPSPAVLRMPQLLIPTSRGVSRVRRMVVVAGLCPQPFIPELRCPVGAEEPPERKV